MPSQFVKGDIQSADLVTHILKSEDIDTIMHFAAQVCLHSPSFHIVHTTLKRRRRPTSTTRLATRWPLP